MKNIIKTSSTDFDSHFDEYRNLFDVLRGKYNFIWITDGLGWEGTSKPLRETFEHNDYLFNLSMLEKGILNFLL